MRDMKYFIYLLFIFSIIFVCASERTKDFIMVEHLIRKGEYKYLNGKPYSGVAVRYYKKSQKMKIRIRYHNGLREGLVEKWFDNGVPLSFRYYHKGRKTGLHRGWHRNGAIRFLYHFSEGKHVGENWAWHDNGHLAQYFKMENGKQVNYKQWRYGGKVFWNTAAQGNRQVGLKGGRLCRQIKGTKNGKTIRL